MIDFLRWLFRRTRKKIELITLPVDEATSAAREDKLKELEQRERDATNRLHVLEWQEAVRSRRYADEQNKEKP